jgi:hypothetical protein
MKKKDETAFNILRVIIWLVWVMAIIVWLVAVGLLFGWTWIGGLW